MFWGDNVFFFFFQFGTSYPLYRYEIVHITIQKENGKKSIHFAQRSWVRGVWFIFFLCFICFVFFFFFVIFRQSGIRATGWQEETETIYKEPECKGMHISTNFVDFQSLKYNRNLEQWNVKWLTKLNRNFIYIPILCYQKWGLAIMFAEWH